MLRIHTLADYDLETIGKIQQSKEWIIIIK